MKKFTLIILSIVCGAMAAHGAALNFGSAAPDATDSASILLQHEAISLWNIEHTGVPTQPKQYTGTPSNFAAGTTDTTVFTLAAGEIGFIQNLSADAPLAVKKGASASTTSFNFILAAGAATDDGKGGVVQINDWIGPVSVAKISGSERYIAWKQAP